MNGKQERSGNLGENGSGLYHGVDEVIQAPFLIRSEDNRATVMGFSRKTVSPETVEDFNRTLAGMIKDGTVDRIEKKYLQ